MANDLALRGDAAGTGDSAPSRALDRYTPGLDGMRAICVGAVLVYHAELGLDAGFLGVSQFFTLSGFLITSILLRRRGTGGRLAFGSFWGQRYRRLLPAAYLTLAGVVLFGATVATEQQLEDLPAGVTSAVAQVANWFFIYNDQSYLDLFVAPSPVQHFWSLAIEEQLYLLLPVALWLLFRATRSLKVVGAAIGLAALASTGMMILLYHQGASLDRLYYGTDTRAGELLVGSVLAVVLHRSPLRLRAGGQRVLAGVGVVALAIMVWCWVNLSLTDTILYRGGLLAYALVSVALILCLLNGRGPAAALLSWRGVAMLGRISYGIYLFHWPIYLWLTQERTGLHLWPLFGVRLAVTLVVATVSYHFLEMPIRNRAWPRISNKIGWAIAPTAAVLVFAALLVSDNREVVTDLAGLGEEASAAPDLPIAGDGVLDVLVITDERGRPLIDELTAHASAGDELTVRVAQPFLCSGVDPGADAPTCANWLAEWPALIAEVDPDVVLVHATEWDAGVAQLSASDQLEEQREWVSATLGAGFDLLSENGATIVWNQSALGFQEAVRASQDPLFQALQAMSSSRTDLRRLQAVTDPVELERALLLYQRRGDTDLPRVLILGDSVSRTLGYGLEQWAAEQQVATVWSAGTEGCGIAGEGVLRDATGRETSSEACRSVYAERESLIQQFDPDLVIVISVADVKPRKLDESSSYQGPGDPGFDDYLVDEFATVYDELSADGAQVLWLLTPCVRSSAQQFLGGDDESIEAFNDLLTERVADERPDLRTFDTHDALCPDGEDVDRVDGVTSIRPDGMHFSPEGSRWFAYTYGSALLEAGLE